MKTTGLGSGELIGSAALSDALSDPRASPALSTVICRSRLGSRYAVLAAAADVLVDATAEVNGPGATCGWPAGDMPIGTSPSGGVGGAGWAAAEVTGGTAAVGGTAGGAEAGTAFAATGAALAGGNGEVVDAADDSRLTAGVGAPPNNALATDDEICRDGIGSMACCARACCWCAMSIA